MWDITIMDGTIFENLGNENTTFSQVVAYLIHYEHIKSIDDIRAVQFWG